MYAKVKQFKYVAEVTSEMDEYGKVHQLYIDAQQPNAYTQVFVKIRDKDTGRKEMKTFSNVINFWDWLNTL